MLVCLFELRNLMCLFDSLVACALPSKIDLQNEGEREREREREIVHGSAS